MLIISTSTMNPGLTEHDRKMTAPGDLAAVNRKCKDSEFRHRLRGTLCAEPPKDELYRLRLALETMLPALLRMAEEAVDPLSFSIQVAAAANLIPELSPQLAPGLVVNAAWNALTRARLVEEQCLLLRQALQDAEHIVYLCHASTEAIWDQVLLATLGAKICYTIGDFEEAWSPELQRALDNADLILAKGASWASRLLQDAASEKTFVVSAKSRSRSAGIPGNDTIPTFFVGPLSKWPGSGASSTFHHDHSTPPNRE